MPSKKKYISIIESFYRHNIEDTGMFFWVEGQRHAVPAVTIERSIYAYFHFMDIEDFNIDSAMATYSRMKKEYYEAASTDR